MNEDMRWSHYIDVTCKGAKNSEIARAVKVDPATVGRWRTGANDPSPRQVVAYARAFDRSPAEALIAAGFLTAEEAGVPIADTGFDPLEAAPTSELVREVLRRVEADEQRDVGGAAQDDDYDFTPEAPSQADYRLAAKKGKKKADQ
ncbi:helix-turn-helix domain-containing protein [Streptomyces sp. NPDC058650]|uniref:helix-turn-helix domain-containing protein n=1 Tax=Streptomyces sp. NPDC058650 TaxID=3346575 RepID=UPI003655E5BA